MGRAVGSGITEKALCRLGHCQGAPWGNGRAAAAHEVTKDRGPLVIAP
jgi:hypothetical protein